MKVKFLFWLASTLVCATISGQTLTTRQLQLLDSISLHDVPEKAPGIATALIENGNVVYEKYAGYAKHLFYR